MVRPAPIAPVEPGKTKVLALNAWYFLGIPLLKIQMTPAIAVFKNRINPSLVSYALLCLASVLFVIK